MERFPLPSHMCDVRAQQPLNPPGPPDFPPNPACHYTQLHCAHAPSPRARRLRQHAAALLPAVRALPPALDCGDRRDVRVVVLHFRKACRGWKAAPLKTTTSFWGGHTIPSLKMR
eukprot:363650-Chlamydomonas_euryale.AAC.8